MATRFITISIEIMHDTNLNQSQKFLLAEIEQLSELEKGCIAANQHFSKLIGITKENVSRNIKSLSDMGYILCEIKNGSRNHIREIRIIKTTRPPYQNDKTPLSKRQETKENKTINKTINTFKPEEAVNLWNHFAEFHNKPKIAKLTTKRREKLVLRIKELQDYKSALVQTLNLASKSKFCLQGKWFSFDWLIENDTNLIKVFEGKYENDVEEYK